MTSSNTFGRNIYGPNISCTGIFLQMAPFEQVSLVGLVRSENKLVNKVVLALSAVCLEASQLTEEARASLFPPLNLYGNGGKALS